MKISVVIPTYKPQDYLWECLDSLNNQTLPRTDFEVILVLNGCCEPFLSQIKHFAEEKSISNLVVVQTDKAGVSNARNLGIDKASGSFLAFVDDDDYVSRDYLQELLATAEKGVTPVSNIIAFDDHSRQTLPNYLTRAFQRFEHEGPQPLFAARSFLSVSVAKLLRREEIAAFRFNPSFSLDEDSLFVFQLSCNLGTVKAAAPNAIYFRRVRSSSALMLQRGFWKNAVNNLRLICVATRIYIANPLRYDFLFYLSRIIAWSRKIFLGPRISLR